MTAQAREPLQVYLTRDERAALERVARRLGISLSEALRRGIRALEREDRTVEGVPGDDAYPDAYSKDSPLGRLIRTGAVAKAAAPPGLPPPVPPDAPRYPLAEILTMLDLDRSDR